MELTISKHIKSYTSTDTPLMALYGFRKTKNEVLQLVNHIHNGGPGADDHHSNEHNDYDPVLDHKPHALLRANRLQVQERRNQLRHDDTREAAEYS